MRADAAQFVETEVGDRFKEEEDKDGKKKGAEAQDGDGGEAAGDDEEEGGANAAWNPLINLLSHSDALRSVDTEVHNSACLERLGDLNDSDLGGLLFKKRMFVMGRMCAAVLSQLQASAASDVKARKKRRAAQASSHSSAAGGGGGGGSSADVEVEELATEEGFAVASSLALSLTLLRSMREAHPDMFTTAVSSLLGLIAVADLRKITKPAVKQLTEMLSETAAEQLDASSGKDRAHGAALLVSMAVAKENLPGMLAATARFVALKTDVTLPSSVDRILDRIGATRTSLPLNLLDPFKPNSQAGAAVRFAWPSLVARTRAFAGTSGVAVGGSFLYVLGDGGFQVAQVGTGSNGTAANVYASAPIDGLGATGIAFAHGKLYLRRRVTVGTDKEGVLCAARSLVIDVWDPQTLTFLATVCVPGFDPPDTAKVVLDEDSAAGAQTAGDEQLDVEYPAPIAPALASDGANVYAPVVTDEGEAILLVLDPLEELKISRRPPLTALEAAGGGPLERKFDTTSEGFMACSFSDEDTTVRSTGSNAWAIGTSGIDSGRATIEFLVTEDEMNNEMINLGVATKPVSRSSSYDSNPAFYIVRAYNGQCYARGSSTGRTVSKIHKGQTVIITVDIDAKTISYNINGSDQGVVFSDIVGEEFFPLVAFYGSGRSATIKRYEREGAVIDAGRPDALREARDATADAVCRATYFTNGDKVGILQALAPKTEGGRSPVKVTVCDTASGNTLLTATKKPAEPGTGAGKFDASAGSPSGLTYSNGDKTVRSTTGSNTLAVLDAAVSSGKAIWEFHDDEDTLNSECTAYGAVKKPLTSFDYTNSQCLMYRAYNAQLYGQGKQMGDRKKIHPGDTVRIEVDMDEGTMRYFVNGEDQGVCFTGISGTIYPACGFYSNNKQISITRFERPGESKGVTVQNIPRALVLDPITNLVWGYRDSTCTVSSWVNDGPAVGEPLPRLASPFSPEEPLSPIGVAIRVLRGIDGHARHYMSGKVVDKLAFCLDTSDATFEALIELLKAGAVCGDARPVLLALRILRAQLHNRLGEGGLGISRGSGDGSECNWPRPLLEAAQELMESATERFGGDGPAVTSAAGAIVAVGMEAFFPSPESQVELLEGLLDQKAKGTLPLASATLLRHLVSRSESVGFLDRLLRVSAPHAVSAGGDGGAGGAEESKDGETASVELPPFINKLLEAVEAEACQVVDEADASSTGDAVIMPLLSGVTRLVVAHAASRMSNGQVPGDVVTALLLRLLQLGTRLVQRLSALPSSAQFSSGQLLALDVAVGPVLTSTVASLAAFIGAAPDLAAGVLFPAKEQIVATLGTVASARTLIPPSHLLSMVATEGTLDSESKEFESAHPYTHDWDEYKRINIPGATELIIEFDERTATEADCDYVRFLKNDEHDEHWGAEKYSGSSSSGNWPGSGGRPPLVIPADSFVLHFKTDNSTSDWGWKFTVKATVAKVATTAEQHWIVGVEDMLGLINDMSLRSMLGAVPERSAAKDGADDKPDGAKKEAKLEAERPTEATWLESKLLRGGLVGSATSENADESDPAPSPPPTPRDDEPREVAAEPDAADAAQIAFFEQVVAREEGTAGAELVKKMKRKVFGDRGHDAPLNRAVWSTACAALRHNHLVSEAIAVAEDRSPPSKAIISVWKSAQKMRTFVTSRSRDESGSADADEDLCAAIEARARMLWSSVVSTASKAKSRWDQVRALARQASTGGGDDKWSEAVQGASRAAEVKELLDFQRAAASAEKSERTPTDLVLGFVQSDIDVEKLQSMARARTQAAMLRAEGLSMLKERIDACGLSLSGRASAMLSWASVMRSFPPRPGSVHMLSGLEGASAASTRLVMQRVEVLLRDAVKLLQADAPVAAGGAGGGSGSEIAPISVTPSTAAAQLAALKALAQDYRVTDAPMLHRCELADVVGGLLQYRASTSTSSAIPALPTVSAKLGGGGGGSSESKADSSEAESKDENSAALAASPDGHSDSLTAVFEAAESLFRLLLSRLVGIDVSQSANISSADMRKITSVQRHLVRSLLALLKVAVGSSEGDPSTGGGLSLGAVDVKVMSGMPPPRPMQLTRSRSNADSDEEEVDVTATALGPSMALISEPVPLWLTGTKNVAPQTTVTSTFSTTFWLHPRGDGTVVSAEEPDPNEMHDVAGAVWDPTVSEKMAITNGGRTVRKASSATALAMLDVGFSSGKAVWEVKIEQDTSGDECCNVGAAVRPKVDDSYNGSGVWMYRAYNGQCYQRGSSTKILSKYTKGDTVRVSLDMVEGTIAYAVNGVDQGVAFTGVSGEVFPAVAIYNTGTDRQISLVRVEATPDAISTFPKDYSKPEVGGHTGGVVFSRGLPGLLNEEERQRALHTLAASVTATGHLKYEVSVPSESEDSKRQEYCAVTSAAPLATDRWTHVAIVHNNTSLQLYIDGEPSGDVKLPSHALSLEGAMESKTHESSHPYQHNQNTFKTFTFPGAASVSISFDARSATEADYDFVRFYKETDTGRGYWGEDKYHGGRGGSSKNWPGCDGRPPLVIPSDHFVLHWKTDNSNNDWGWKATFTPKRGGGVGSGSAATEEADALTTLLHANPSPYYFGQPPQWGVHGVGAQWFVGGATLYPFAALQPEQARALQRRGAVPMPPARTTDEDQTLALLAAIGQTLGSSTGRTAFAAPHALPRLLSLIFSPCTPICLAALRICSKFIHSLPPSLVNSALTEATGDTRPLVQRLMSDIGHTLSVWTVHAAGSPKRRASGSTAPSRAQHNSEHAFSTASEKITLVQTLLTNSEWAGSVKDSLQMALAAAPFVIENVKAAVDGERLDSETDEGVCLTVATLAIFGGTFTRVRLGGRANYVDSVGVVEPVTVLRRTGTGSAVVVLDSNPRETTTAPLSRLYALAESVPTGLWDAMGETKSMFVDLIPELMESVPTRSTFRPPRARAVTTTQVASVESEHPYLDDTDMMLTLSIPGAERMEIRFDERTSLHDSGDYVQLFLDSGRTARVGAERYTGRRGGAAFPGVGSTPPLTVNAQTVYVWFHTDAAGTDWGFKVAATAKADAVREVEAVPPTRAEALLCDLRARAVCALDAMLAQTGGISDAAKVLSPLVHAAVRVNPADADAVFDATAPASLHSLQQRAQLASEVLWERPRPEEVSESKGARADESKGGDDVLGPVDSDDVGDDFERDLPAGAAEAAAPVVAAVNGEWGFLKNCSIDSDKTVLTSSSGRGIGVCKTGFDSGKAEWEFEILAEKDGDEGTNLGAASSATPSSHDYNGPETLVLRAFNGECYKQGSSVKTVTKLHKGDKIVVKLDMDAKTMSYVVNGTDLGVIFSGLPAKVWPACAWYGSSTKKVRLKYVRKGWGGAPSGGAAAADLDWDATEDANPAYEVLDHVEGAGASAAVADSSDKEHNVASLLGGHLRHLWSYSHSTNLAVEVQLARRCVLGLLKGWPAGTPLSRETLGATSTLLQFLRSAYALAGTGFSHVGEPADSATQSMLRVLENQLVRLCELQTSGAELTSVIEQYVESLLLRATHRAKKNRKQTHAVMEGVDVACWLVGVIGHDAGPIVASRMATPRLLRRLRIALETLPHKAKAEVLSCLTMLLHSKHALSPAPPQDHAAGGAGGAGGAAGGGGGGGAASAAAPEVTPDESRHKELVALATSLAKLITKRMASEKTKTNKSRFLQAAVECGAALRSAVETFGSAESQGGSSLSSAISAFAVDSSKAPDSVEITKHGSTIAVKKSVSGSEWYTAVTKVAASEGVHSWDITLSEGDPSNVKIGVIRDDAPIAELGTASASYGICDGKLWTGGSSVAYGPKMRLGDVITVTLDITSNVLSFARNGAELGIAVSPKGGAATGAFDAGAWYPAVSLKTAATSVSIAPHESTATGVPGKVDLMKGEIVGPLDAISVLQDIQMAGQALEELARGAVPHTLLRAYYAADDPETATIGGSSGKGKAIVAKFDRSASSTSGLTFSNDDKTVRSTTGSNTLAVLETGFSAGISSWEFTLDEDSRSDECTCFGATTKPISSHSYSASHCFTVRAYNGQLYGSGKVGGNREKVHPGDTCSFEYDADRGELSFSVNGASQGVIFNGLAGRELFPCIGFYSSNKQASITRVSSTDKKKKAASATAAAGGAGGASAEGDTVAAKWERSAGSSSGLEYSDGDTTVKSTTGSNTLAVLDKGFGPGSGTVCWEIRNVEDTMSSECTCYGITSRPVSSFSYSAAHCRTYRCYNGQLYGMGKSGSNRQVVHPGDTVRMELDTDKGTLEYFVSGVSQGVCFSGISQWPQYPVVGFYSSGKKSSLVRVWKKGAAGPVSSLAGEEIAGAAFDTSASSSSGVTFSEGNRLMRCTTGSNTLSVVNQSFSSGIAVWEFECVEDRNGDQCLCYGATRKPITSHSYSAPHCYMLRAYNGQLYGANKVGGNRAKVSTNQVVRVTYDAGARTLAFAVDGVDQGVCFNNVNGPLFPAVGTYSSGRSARLKSCRRVTAAAAAAAGGAGGPESATDVRDGVWDSSDSPGFSLSNGNKTCETQSGGDKMAVMKCGFSSGKHVWSLRVDKDDASDEALTYGCATKPIRNRNYSSSGARLIRGYNGQLYGPGKVSGNKSKIHPGDIVEFRLDMDAGTLEVSVNGASQGVCWTGITGTVYPVVCSYASRAGKKVSIIKVQDISAAARVSGIPLNATFDVSAGSSSGLTYSAGNKTVRSTTSSNTLAVVGTSITTGKVTINFRLDEDSHGGECSCFGITTKPISKFSYDGSTCRMYRAYNGQLYGSGKTASNKEKIHPGDLVTVKLDMDAGTMSYSVRGMDQGVCFRGITGPVYPAIGFYSSGKQVSCVSVEREGAPAGAATAESVSGVSFDAASSSPGMSFSDGNMTVKSTASGKSLAVINKGFNSGRVVFSFRVDVDDMNDEASVFGVTEKPITSFEYTAPHCYMYRAYNGNLYGAGKTPGTKAKIHPGSIVVGELDFDAGTLSFLVDGESQGVCFRSLTGKTLYPAVGFYAAAKQVTFLGAERPKVTTLDVRGATWDSRAGSTSGLSYSNGNKTVKSTKGGNTLAVLSSRFDSGRVMFEFKIDEDKMGDETTCLGLTLKPITKFSYDAPHCRMIRCYSGQLYGAGKSGSGPKIHKGDVALFDVDLDAGTVSLIVNGGAPQVIFNGVSGPIWPAVGFYGSNRQVSVMKVRTVIGEAKDADEDSKVEGAHWDEEESGDGFVFSRGHKTFLTKSSKKQLAVMECGFTEGRAVWEYRCEIDDKDDEALAYGATLKPITKRSYDAPHAMMLRGYNGQLYGPGKASGRKSKVHPGDVVTCELDMTKGELSFKVNGVSQGVCFTGLAGKTVYPACAAYSEGKQVSILRASQVAAPREVEGGVFHMPDSSGGVALSNAGRTAKSSSSQALAVMQCRFSTGKYKWELHLDEDSHGGECVAFGVTTLPSGGRYDAPSCRTYRAYNGQLYGAGKVAGSKQKIHPGDVVLVELDCDAGTLSFAVNGASQGVTHTGLTGQTWAPCVGFYSSGRQVSIMRVEELGTAPVRIGKADVGIGVGDRVVRGPDWEHEDQDGGPGSFGTVVELTTFRGKARRGVSVKWTETGATYLYRWGYDGAFDVRVFGPRVSLRRGDDDSDDSDAEEGTTAPPAKESYHTFALRHALGWSRDSDAELVRYINDVALKKEMGASRVSRCDWSDLAPEGGGDSAADWTRFPALTRLPVEGDGSGYATAMAARFRIIRDLNSLLSSAMPYIDLSRAEEVTAGTSRAGVAHLGARLAQCRYLMFGFLKQPVWDTALAASRNTSDSKFDLRVSRAKAARHAARGVPDTEGRYALFSQAFRQMHTRPAHDLRRHGTLYTAHLLGEHSHDAGGPYRETWAQYCAELQSEHLSLLRRTPNGRLNVGQNRDCWVPNPAARSRTALDMFAFLGKLMGCAIRNKEYLDLRLPAFVWKKLANDVVTTADIRDIDLFAATAMDKMRDIEREGVTEETFSECFVDMVFTCIGLDGEEHEIVPGGRSRPVTWHNREEYIEAVEAWRLCEIDAQIAAIRAGLATIVPQRLLCLFDWTEVERMVCGNPDIDIDLLKSATVVEGLGSDVMDRFWSALREMSGPERALFLRFVWGRSRLPLSKSGFKQKFRIKPFGRHPPDRFLPEAHTCFFQLDLPAYSTVAIMKEKLTYAAFHCQAIDADDTSTARATAEAGWGDE